MSEICLILLPCGETAIVDAEDQEFLSNFSWNKSTSGYAQTVVRKDVMEKYGLPRKIYMHRLIIGAGKGQEVDHINRQKLDNRRVNLRICHHRQNMGNLAVQRRKKSSKYKGVHWDKKGGYWIAQIRVNYKKIHLGCFANESAAAIAYNISAKKYFGSFSLQNEIADD